MWIDIGKVSYNYFRIKGSVHNLRLTNPNHKYRIIGRDVHPWCEIKEGTIDCKEYYQPFLYCDVKEISNILRGDAGKEER